MNQAILQIIKNEAEKIETFPGHGEIRIVIVNGVVQRIIPAPSILVAEFDKKNEPCYKSK